ncbi:alpha/beta hydrolase [Mesorhizobium sp.]|uniref:alpha/beta fold hydrolase n=2 Tax=Mesorhizobium sp. TaxID=1871066 RepID=UPI000FE321DB|nr:alpha/beta hydrolase [Mesorhizobium sp.]RWN55488.1 MAG: alpha/beta hydrolase [Mesorhizobium sp.]RWN77363.1 MAG: alpha/beta hydrolase [Mesorhizobium sp.]RWN80100.1 MAG: alpha/beta hydrolase [Mesorhizobium sp.]RWN87265.1 MAG: alpha/beta hydrolase [Mesorhizobium sp.]RWO15099.1 MAG: alpha/beta hydrolase [Mesorhizobium sp.]
MNVHHLSRPAAIVKHRDVPTKTVDVGGTKFAYRELGPTTGVPVIFLTHLSAVLDNWDPRVVDGIAAKRRVVTFDNRGVGASGGSTPSTVEAMARDAIAFIRALGFEKVDLLGLSLGGFIAQAIVQLEPNLVRKIILAGTGPAGGTGIDRVTFVTFFDMIRAALTIKDPKNYLFFTQSPNGKKAAREFLQRLNERTNDRDKPIALGAFSQQLKAVRAFGLERPADLSRVRHPVLVVNGDHDRMVPTSNSVDLARRLPNAELVLYEDGGHTAIFQYHGAFVEKALDFLDA